MKFRASGFLMFFFGWLAFNDFTAGFWGRGLFDVALALCLLACFLNRPIRIGDFIEFSGW